jgi:hypothetical protein
MIAAITHIDMPARKPKTYKLDGRLIEALDRLAEQEGLSSGSYVEQVLWAHCQGKGVIPLGGYPPKDQRGGARPNSGRPRKQADPDSTQSDGRNPGEGQ